MSKMRRVSHEKVSLGAAGKCHWPGRKKCHQSKAREEKKCHWNPWTGKKIETSAENKCHWQKRENVTGSKTEKVSPAPRLHFSNSVWPSAESVGNSWTRRAMKTEGLFPYGHRSRCVGGHVCHSKPEQQKDDARKNKGISQILGGNR